MPNSIQNFALYLDPTEHLTMGRPSVEEFLDRTGQQAPASAVVVLDGVPDAAVVTPHTREAVRQLFLSTQAGLLESGVWDFVRQHQLSVREDQPAADVMRVVEHTPDGVDWVTVLDGGGHPVGLVTPAGLAGRILNAGLVREAGMQGELAPYAEREDLVGLIDAIDRRIEDFHSEGLNSMRPTLYECIRGDGGTHLVSRNPCAQHPGASIQPIQL